MHPANRPCLAESLGINFGEAALKSKGFGGVLQEIIQKTGGSSESLNTLFGSIEAINVLAIGKNDFEGYKSIGESDRWN